MPNKTTLAQIVMPKLNLKDKAKAKNRAASILISVVIKDGAATLTITQQGLESSTARARALKVLFLSHKKPMIRVE